MLGLKVVKLGRYILDGLPDDFEKFELVFVVKRELKPKFQGAEEVVDAKLDYIRSRNLNQAVVMPNMSILLFLIYIVLG